MSGCAFQTPRRKNENKQTRHSFLLCIEVYFSRAVTAACYTSHLKDLQKMSSWKPEAEKATHRVESIALFGACVSVSYMLLSRSTEWHSLPSCHIEPASPSGISAIPLVSSCVAYPTGLCVLDVYSLHVPWFKYCQTERKAYICQQSNTAIYS